MPQTSRPNRRRGDWARAGYDLVLLDPPRAGAREILPIATASRPRRLVYVSCHAGSFARDAGILAGQLGYRLAAAGIMDMFPQTSHVETIALFEPAAMTLGPGDGRPRGHRDRARGARDAPAPAGRQRHPLRAQLREPGSGRAPGRRTSTPSARRRCSSRWTRRAGACSASGQASRACRRCATSAAATRRTVPWALQSHASSAGSWPRSCAPWASTCPSRPASTSTTASAA